MREYLFRGKRLDNGEWIEGSLIIYEWDNNYVSIYSNEEEMAFQVDPETVGQYTELTDKDGRKIFEGDYVVCKQQMESNHIDHYVELGYVEMKYGAFGLHRKQGYYRPFKDWLEDYEYEVIGNIHDNLELLEGHKT